MKAMNSSDAIILRFFSALDRLIADHVLTGVKSFTDLYGINRWNFATMKKDITRGGNFQPVWLAYLVDDFKVSPHWLLLGVGDFWLSGFDAEIVRKLQKNRNPKSA